MKEACFCFSCLGSTETPSRLCDHEVWLFLFGSPNNINTQLPPQSKVATSAPAVHKLQEEAKGRRRASPCPSPCPSPWGQISEGGHTASALFPLANIWSHGYTRQLRMLGNAVFLLGKNVSSLGAILQDGFQWSSTPDIGGLVKASPTSSRGSCVWPTDIR